MSVLPFVVASLLIGSLVPWLSLLVLILTVSVTLVVLQRKISPLLLYYCTSRRMLISSRNRSASETWISESGMVQRSSLVPWTSWWSTLFHWQSPQPMDRALGAAATLALSLAMLRFVGQAIKSTHERNETAEDSALSSSSKLSSTLTLLLSAIRKGLWRILSLTITNNHSNNHSNECRDDTQEWIVHRGSCHCNAIQFELVAPKTVKARCGQGKIQFPHSKTKANHFRLIQGTEHLHMYYVNMPCKEYGVEPVTSAHSFCCQCGVSILHAPNSKSAELDVNVSCLDNPNVQIIRTQQKLLSGGFPLAGQWEQPSVNSKRNEPFGPVISEDEDDEFDVQQDTSMIRMSLHQHQQLEDNPRLLPPECPGTPSTIGTSATENTQAALRVRPIGWDHGSVASSEDLDSTTESASLGPGQSPPLGRRLVGSSVSSSLSRRSGTSTTTTAKSILSEATTPIMRNQLKQYMSKHLAHPQGIGE